MSLVFISLAILYLSFSISHVFCLLYLLLFCPLLCFVRSVDFLLLPNCLTSPHVCTHSHPRDKQQQHLAVSSYREKCSNMSTTCHTAHPSRVLYDPYLLVKSILSQTILNKLLPVLYCIVEVHPCQFSAPLVFSSFKSPCICCLPPSCLRPTCSSPSWLLPTGMYCLTTCLSVWCLSAVIPSSLCLSP